MVHDYLFSLARNHLGLSKLMYMHTPSSVYNVLLRRVLTEISTARSGEVWLRSAECSIQFPLNATYNKPHTR